MREAIRRRPAAVVAVVGAAGALAYAVANAMNGVGGMFANDGHHYLFIAQHITETPHSGEGVFRFGRILYPALGWLLAAGRPTLVPYALIGVNIAAAGLLVWATAHLLRGTAPTVVALAALVLPGVVWSLRYGYLDLVAVALTVAACLAVERRRPGWAVVAFAASILTRETCALAVVAIAVPAWREGRRRDALVLLSSGLPLVAWWLALWVRTGQLVPIADTPARARAVTFPFGALREMPLLDAAHIGALAAGALCLVVAILLLTLHPSTVVARVAIAFGLFVPFIGPSVWTFSGDSLRVLLPAMLFAAIAIAHQLRAPADVPVTADATRSSLLVG